MSMRSLGISQGLSLNCPPHQHDVWEVVINTSGTGQAFIEDKSYAFTESTIMCIPPHAVHYKQADKGFLDIHFHTDSMLIPNNITVSEKEPIILQDTVDKSLETIVRLMANIHYQQISNERAIVTSLYNSAMQLLIGLMSAKRIDPVIQQIQNSLIASFSDPEINIANLLANYGYSSDYLRKRFREETGMTIMDYLTRLRIDYAKQLLSQRKILQLSIAEIASMCGYYDVHYFSRVFHKATNMTPKNFSLYGDLSIASDSL